VIFHCFFLCLPGGAFFSFSPERSEGKNGPPGRQRGTTEGQGEGPRGGQGECQTALSFGRSRAVPKGRPEAKRSRHPRPWEWIKGARLSATERLLLPCRIRQLERENNQAGQIRLLKLIGIRTQQAPTGSLKCGERGIGDSPTVSRPVDYSVRASALP
jgi:hypothetical protein